MARKTPEINASSMADIAFLLLTFFLIAMNMEKNGGIQRILPDLTKEPPKIEVNERNVLRYKIDAQGVIRNKKGVTKDISLLSEEVKAFVDNGVGIGDKACHYCQGEKDPRKSDNPLDAIIAVEFSNSTNNGVYMQVQNQLDKAYNELRNQYAQSTYQLSYQLLPSENKKEVRARYPRKIAEAKLK